ERSRLRELLGQARKDRSRSEKHQPKVPQRMQQQNWDHDRTRLEPWKHRQQIKLGRDRKYDRAEQEIDGEDVHLRLLRISGDARLSPARGLTRGLRLLRADGERPCDRAAENRDELTSLHRCNHSITSSARASSVGGSSMPSAFAVVRLTTSSNLVGCSTGRSAGFAPRRILSTYSDPGLRS